MEEGVNISTKQSFGIIKGYKISIVAKISVAGGQAVKKDKKGAIPNCRNTKLLVGGGHTANGSPPVGVSTSWRQLEMHPQEMPF